MITNEDDREETAEDWPVGGGSVAQFLRTVSSLANSHTLLRDAGAGLASRPGMFRPDLVLIPALEELRHEKLLDLSNARHPLTALWKAAAEFHLDRSAQPPEPPSDWRLRNQRTSCRCEDCQRLMAFVRDPNEQVARFPLAQNRRQHVRSKIDECDLEMTYETERRGRPFTLVLTKTRWRHEERQKVYEADLTRMETLAGMTSPRSAASVRSIATKLRAALRRI